MRDDVARRTVFEVVQQVLPLRGSHFLALDLVVLVAGFEPFADLVEVVHVNLRTLFEFLVAVQESINAINRNRRVADGRGQQMRANHVAANKDMLFAGVTVILVGFDQAIVVVELLDTREVDTLADSGHDQVGRQITFGACGDFGFFAFHREVGNAQRNGATFLVQHTGNRRHTAENFNAFLLGVFDFMLGRVHLVDGGARHQHNLGTVTGRDRRDVVGHVAGDDVFSSRTLVRRAGFGHVAQTTGDSHDVDRGVATADHDDA